MSDFKEPRYELREQSVTGHCCFGYTIVDTSIPKGVGGFETERDICETFTREHAELIVKALNSYTPQEPSSDEVQWKVSE